MNFSINLNYIFEFNTPLFDNVSKINVVYDGTYGDLFSLEKGVDIYIDERNLSHDDVHVFSFQKYGLGTCISQLYVHQDKYVIGYNTCCENFTSFTGEIKNITSQEEI